MLRKIILFCLIFESLNLIISCNNNQYSILNGNETSSATSTEMTYSSFKGLKYKTIHLKEGDKLKLDIDVTTIEGDLKISLITESGDELFSIKNPSYHITENISIPTNGLYYIEIFGNHSGSYEVNWDIII